MEQSLGAPGKQQALSPGWRKFWDYHLPGQVSAGQSFQSSFKGFELVTKQDASEKVMITQIMSKGQVYHTAVGHIPISLETTQVSCNLYETRQRTKTLN